MKTLILILCLLFTTGCLDGKKESNPPPIVENNVQGMHPNNIYDQWAKENGKTEEETQLFFFENYSLNGEEDIYTNLPTPVEKPSESVRRWEDHNVSMLLEIPPSIYLQPEFYPTFLKQGKKWWSEADGINHPTVGIFSTPAQQEAEIGPQESAIETVLFIGGTWGSTYYQGMGLYYDIQPAAPLTIQFDPADMVVGPTFPQFAQNWVERIHITGTITPLPGVEEYIIYIRTKPPNQEKENEWIQTYSPYTRTNPLFVDPVGVATLIVKVKEK